jgi:DNA repair exonuclease SbcCD ATPase subunit
MQEELLRVKKEFDAVCDELESAKSRSLANEDDEDDQISEVLNQSVAVLRELDGINQSMRDHLKSQVQQAEATLSPVLLPKSPYKTIKRQLEKAQVDDLMRPSTPAAHRPTTADAKPSVNRLRAELIHYQDLLKSLSATAQIQANTISVLVQEQNKRNNELSSAVSRPNSHVEIKPASTYTSSDPSSLSAHLKSLEHDAKELHELARTSRIPADMLAHAHEAADGAALVAQVCCLMLIWMLCDNCAVESCPGQE